MKIEIILFKSLFLRFFIGNLQNTKDHVIFGKEYKIGSVSESLDFIQMDINLYNILRKISEEKFCLL